MAEGKTALVRRWAVSVGVLASALAASTGSTGAATTTVDAGPGRQIMPAFQKVKADANAFFRRSVTIHKGDSVRWRINGFHTVTFAAKGNPRPDFFVPDADNLVSGVVDPSGAPFWFNGQPRIIGNPLVVFPQGGKTFSPATFHNSGIPLGRPKPYQLKFNRTGTFRYYCSVHPLMRGSVRVVRRSASVPTAGQNRRAARRAMQTLLKRAQRATTGVTVRGGVQAGNDDRDGTTILKFFPRNATVKAGGTLTLRMDPQSTEQHTFTFGPMDGRDAYVNQILRTFFVPEPSPGGGPPTVVIDPRAAYPSEPPPAGVPSLTPTLHGNGFFNTGVMDAYAKSPLPGRFNVRFPTAGTYRYLCIIHPEMRGRITVTP